MSNNWNVKVVAQKLKTLGPNVYSHAFGICRKDLQQGGNSNYFYAI